MADTSNFKVPHKRRRKQQTDYKQREKLLKSDNPRVVVRTSNKHTKLHLAYYEREGDKNADFTSTEELENYGWEQNTGSIPAAYLAGYLLAKKTEETDAVLDLGLRESKKGGRIFAAVKGINDGGLNVPAGEEAYPVEERLTGEHIKEMTGEDVPENLEEVKENIEGEF